MKWAFEQLSSALGSKELDDWTKAIERWERGESRDNPYEVRANGEYQSAFS
jgi:hypothetical protein